MSEYDGFRVERDRERGVATITLDVPGKYNRVSMAARGQLAQLFGELDGEEGVRFVVLAGAGGAFSAGGDIAGFLSASPWEVSQLAGNVGAPERCSKLVIAALSGFVFGVGLEFALACDFRIAADDIKLALPEATIGMIPGSGGSQRLARMIGLGRAKDIVMRGRRVGADEALALGLVNEVVAPGRHVERALELAEALAAHPQDTMLSDRRAVLEGEGLTLAQGLALEAALGRERMATAREGAERFQNRAT
jgi:enoyl-CoA hydratase/carnithine racemase